MQNVSINPQKITREHRHDNKGNRSGFDICYFSNPSYEINKLAGQKTIKHTKPYQTAYKI
jgi:hypothetical protein